MNTTARGNELEDNVFALLCEMISEDRFFAKREYCRIFQKKGYYSKDREKKITFDISIEITLPGQSTYSVLVLIECKNYNHRVPVDDVEEFFSKAQQISPSNTKAIVVSTNAFQESAFTFARSKGIGLLRYFDKGTLDWVLTRSPSSIAPRTVASSYFSVTYEGLHSQDYISRYFDCYGFADEIYTNSLNQFFSRVIRFDADENFGALLADVEHVVHDDWRLVPYKEHHEIEALSRNVLQTAKYSGGAAPLNEICESLSIDRGLKVRRRTSLARGVLGVISFEPLLIEIDDAQAETLPRIQFTLAHELGHFFLDHQKYMRREVCHESDVDLEKPVEIGIKDVVRMEWQANYFASCVVLPAEYLVRIFLLQVAKHQLTDRGYGLLYLDSQRCNVDMFYSVTTPIMEEFAVSRSVVKIRLMQLGFLGEGPGHPSGPINPPQGHLRAFQMPGP